VVNLFFAGYVFTAGTGTARLTIVAGGQKLTRNYRADTDHEFGEPLSVKLWSRSELNISAIDGNINS
jgi:hypothetical protein